MSRASWVACLTTVLVGALLVGDVQGRVQPDEASLKKFSKELDRTIDRYVRWLTRMYKLDDQQQQRVRHRLQELKQRHMQYGPEVAEQMRRLREEVRFYVEQARKGKRIDTEKVRDLQRRLVALVEKAPLNWMNVIKEVESMLPKEQVEQGRKRRREFQERLREWRKRQDRLRPPPIPMPTDALKPYLEPITPYERRLTGSEASQGTRAGAQARKPSGQVAPPVARRPKAEAPRIVAPMPLDEWTRYVQEFIKKYKLDTKQQRQAWQILEELKKRAEEYRLSHKPDYDAAKRISDAKLRSEEIELLDKPIREMFEELKRRLDRIPTAAQREAAKAAESQSKSSKAPTTRGASKGAAGGK